MVDIKVDLHLHTTASDGTWSPEQLVGNLQKADIRLFAVTDHDTTENVLQTEALAQSEGISIIRGVEISAGFNERTYHILAYGIDLAHSELQKLLKSNTKLMEDNNTAGILYLASKHPQVSFEEYSHYVNDRKRGGWKSLNYLIDKGLCTDHRGFFALFRDWDDSFSKVAFEQPSAVINTIKEAGGAAVLAHPGSKMYGDNLPITLAMMLEFGIDGFECYHPENSSEATNACLRFCNEHSLYITGGSDCHGGFVGSRHLCHPPVHLSQLRLPLEESRYVSPGGGSSGSLCSTERGICRMSHEGNSSDSLCSTWIGSQVSHDHGDGSSDSIDHR